MKYFATLCVLTLAAATTNSFGAGVAYSTGFGDAFGDFPFDLSGEVPTQDGWSVNDSAPDSTFFTTGFGLGPGSDAAVLGGIFVDETSLSTGTVRLSHGFGGTIGTENGAKFGVEFQVNPSFDDTGLGGDDETGNNDTFGFSFLSSGTPLMRIAFEPGTATTQDLEFVWYDNLGARNRIPLPGGLPGSGSDIAFTGFYELDIHWTPGAGGTTDFYAELNAAVGVSPIPFSGNLSVAPTTILDDVSADWIWDNPTNPDPLTSGNNQIVFDNFSIIPEPSTALTAGLALLLLGFRRKRH